MTEKEQLYFNHRLGILLPQYSLKQVSIHYCPVWLSPMAPFSIVLSYEIVDPIWLQYQMLLNLCIMCNGDTNRYDKTCHERGIKTLLSMQNSIDKKNKKQMNQLLTGLTVQIYIADKFTFGFCQEEGDKIIESEAD